MSETDLSRNVRKAIERMGRRVLRLQSGRVKVTGGYMQLCPEGTPDLLVRLKRGRHVYLEVKRPGEEPTAVQLAEHEQIRQDGHTVCVVHDVQSAVDAVARAMGDG